MKKLLATLLILVACIHVNAQESRQIRISTDRTDLILEVAPDVYKRQDLLFGCLVPEVSETDKYRHHRCREGTGAKHPKRGPAAIDEVTEDTGLF